MPGSEQRSLLERLGDLPEELCTLAGKLERVIPGRENDVLSLGRWLQHIRGGVQELAEDAFELNALASGEEVRTVRHDLAGESIPAVLNEWDAGSVHGDLTVIDDCLIDLEGLLKDFSRVVRHLKALRMSTRIESARLGEGGNSFISLADDVGLLTRDIAQASESMAGRSKVLAHLLGLVRGNVVRVTEIHEASAARTSGRLHKSLEDLELFMDKAAEHVQTVSRTMQEVAHGMAEIVAAMQFQDITRQQVEHAAQALRDGADLARDKALSGLESFEPAEVASWIAEICRLQERQTTSARDRLVQAVQSILDNTGRVAGSVERISGRMSHGLGVDQGHTALSLVEDAIGAVSQSIEDLATQGGCIGQGMHDFAVLVEDMAGFADRIEEMGASIEIIALNASVKAAHVHECGTAMGVLATAVKGLAEQAAGLGKEVAARLAGMQQAAQRLQAVSLRLMDVGPIRDTLARHAVSVQRLRAVDGKVRQKERDLSAKGEQLVFTIMDRVESTGFHLGLGQELSRLVRAIGDTAGSLEGHLPAGERLTPPDFLQQAFGRYTMDAERTIHLSGEEVPVPGGRNQGSPEEKGLGDNVELF